MKGGTDDMQELKRMNTEGGGKKERRGATENQ